MSLFQMRANSNAVSKKSYFIEAGVKEEKQAVGAREKARATAKLWSKTDRHMQCKPELLKLTKKEVRFPIPLRSCSAILSTQWDTSSTDRPRRWHALSQTHIHKQTTFTHGHKSPKTNSVFILCHNRYFLECRRLSQCKGHKATE